MYARFHRTKCHVRRLGHAQFWRGRPRPGGATSSILSATADMTSGRSPASARDYHDHDPMSDHHFDHHTDDIGRTNTNNDCWTTGTWRYAPTRHELPSWVF